MVLAPGIEGELLASPLPAMKCVAELRMVGVSHRTADFSVRSALSLNTVQAQDLLGRLKEEGVSEALALSTCNRTEIYFVGVEASQVRSAVCDFCNLDFATFSRCGICSQWRQV
jgi:glutamyl-tRNA reductase